jgi:hypothetical protein
MCPIPILIDWSKSSTHCLTRTSCWNDLLAMVANLEFLVATLLATGS